MSYSTSDSAACELRVAAQSILSEGYFLFGNMPSYSDAQHEVQEDIQALLHGPEAACEAVIQKVQEFLKVVHQRAIGDMAQLRPHDFHVLWCGGDEDAISNALKEYSICLKTRENLDMGWVSSPLGKFLLELKSLSWTYAMLFSSICLNPATNLQLPFHDLPFADVCGIIARS